jgi:hypothetical protein
MSKIKIFIKVNLLKLFITIIPLMIMLIHSFALQIIMQNYHHSSTLYLQAILSLFLYSHIL